MMQRVVLLLLVVCGRMALASPLPPPGDDAAATPHQERKTAGTGRQFAVTIPELKQTTYQSLHGDGGYSFGYAYPDQMHTESRSADGEVTGSYFYVDPNGNSNQVQYRADKSGFRVTANNLPVYSAQPVKDTAEVAEARQKHLEAWEAIANHNRAQAAAAEFRTDPPERGIVVEAEESVPLPVEEVLSKKEEEEASPVLEQRNPSAARKEVQHEEEYVAPLDLEPVPVSAQANPPVNVIDNDAVVDEEKDAVSITNVQPVEQPSLIEIDAEPIKLLAQLYGKHIQQQNAEVPQEIPRPEGFHPFHLEPPADGFDLFTRSETEDRESIEVTNPEYVDLRAFLLANRFRGEQPDLVDVGPQIILEAKDRIVPSASYQQEAEYDLQTSDDDDEVDEPGNYNLPLAHMLYNQYYNLPLDRPVFINRETLKDLPESLKMAMLGVSAVDGQHTAQVAPARPQLKQSFGGGYHQQGTVFSPYSSYYSPYYYYNSHRWNSDPYYSRLYSYPVRAYAVAKPTYSYPYDPYYYY